MVHTLICQNPACGKTFPSKKPDRKYCTLKCYASTPEFKARRDEHLKKARANRKPVSKSGNMVACPHCGRENHFTPNEIKRGRRFCNREHYRAYMAGRFDRAIATPVSFKDMQGFDEFLSQEKLPCLIEGCNWVGDNLALHVNQAHGISADAFKRMAGFNLSTGLVSTKMHTLLVERGNCGTPRALNQKLAVASRKFDYVSNERKEHAQKAAHLRQRDANGRWIKDE